jgi:hypothetical protein
LIYLVFLLHFMDVVLTHTLDMLQLSTRT